MKDTFHDRWIKLTQTARTLPQEDAAPLPLGFTTRLLANYQRTPEDPLLDWLTAFGMRAAIASAVVFTLSLSLFLARLDPTELATHWHETPLPTQLLLP